VTHRGVAFAFCTMHFLICVLTLLKVFDNGFVTTESLGCYLTWPLMHGSYLVLNAFLFWFFLTNFLDAAKSDLAGLLGAKVINSGVF
jgi:hypothetical protein